MNSTDYYNWLKKFKKRTTSDDTFTPPKVYDVVREYVHNHIINLDDLNVVRPFYPGGDYQAVEYDNNDIVIDNPPFSIISQICQFYQEKGVKFFLFAPALTVFNAVKNTQGLTAIISAIDISYDNGAVVTTAFITNLTPNIRAYACSVLYQALKDNQKQKAKIPKYQYPPNLLMVNDLQKLAKNGIDFEVLADESMFIGGLDSQKPYKKKLFGGGLLVSGKKAKELQAKLLQAHKPPHVWELSEREQQITMVLGDS